MEHIFVAGAFFTTSKEDTDLFPFIVNIIKSNIKNIEVIQPTDIEDYRHEVERKNPNISFNKLNKAMVDYDLELAKNSKLFIADVSNKSLGLGLELGVIKQNNVPLELIAKNGSKISNMVLGAFPETEIKYYNNKMELEKIILEIINNYNFN